MNSLQASVVASLPFEELEEICFGPPTQLQNALDCDWGVWRDRAQALYNISPAFFDLPRTFFIRRNISGLQRYIELSNSVRLNSQAGVRVYENGLIEGVYEAAEGLKEALLRDDPQGVDYFLQRIRPEALAYLAKNDLRHGEDFGLRAAQELEKRTGLRLRNAGGDRPFPIVKVNMADLQDLNDLQKARKLFSDILRSGDPQYFDQVVPYVMPVPPDFTLRGYIPKLPFQVLDPNWSTLQPVINPFPLVKIPGARPGEVTGIGGLFGDALYGGNVQMVDFLRSYFGLRVLGPIRGSFISSENIFEGYYVHRRIEDAYSLFQRTAVNNFDIFNLSSSPDILLYASLQPHDEDWNLPELFRIFLGDIPLVLTLFDLLPTIDQEEKEDLKEFLHVLLDVPFQPDGEKIIIIEGEPPLHLRDEPDISIYPLTESIYRQLQREL